MTDAIASALSDKTTPLVASLRERLLATIRAEVTDAPRISSAMLFNQLVQCLPKENRALPKDVEGRVAELARLLPKNLRGTYFDPAKLGLTDRHFARDVILREYRELVAKEQKIVPLAEAWAMLQARPDDFPKTADEAYARINELDEASVDVLRDLRELNPRMRSVGAPADSSLLVGAISSHVRALDSGMQVKKIATKGIELIEVPPEAAIFRGNLGDDCSSSLSFAYPNSPDERTWFIRALEGESATYVGYVSATRVRVDGGRPAIVVHSIAGKTLTTADVQRAIHGVYEARARLGVDLILTPGSTGRISAMNNFAAPRDVLDSLAAMKAEGALELGYPDADIRAIFGKDVSNEGYDGPLETGVRYEGEFAEGKATAIEISHAPFDLDGFLVSQRVAGALEALKFGIDLLSSENYPNAARIVAL